MPPPASARVCDRPRRKSRRRRHRRLRAQRVHRPRADLSTCRRTATKAERSRRSRGANCMASLPPSRPTSLHLASAARRAD
eukprot:1058160-Prymnesium_polylepis.2